MEDSFEQNQGPFNAAVNGYPPKPLMAEQNKNTITRSLISLLIYAMLFYFLFNGNVAYIAAILLVIIVHEMGHFAFMKLFGYSQVRIFIVPLLGAFTTGKKQDVSQWRFALIILAGPVPGLIIGSILYYFFLRTQDETLKMLATSFLYINLLNCLPFYPLDGGRLIETLFFRHNHVLRLVFGIFSIIALSVLFFASPVMLIVPVLIAFELFNERKHQKIREYLDHEKINYHTDYQHLPDKDYWLIRDCILFSFPKKYAGVNPGEYQYSIAEPLLMQHINSVLQVNLIQDLSLVKKLAVLLFYLAAFFAPLFLLISNI